MKKKTKIVVGIISALLVMASVVGGVFLGLFADSLFGNEEVVNLADIEWYDEKGEEFTISTPKQLYELVALSHYYSFEGQIIKLDADIVVNEGNAADWEANKPSKKWQPITNFAGTFDGQEHTISGLYGYNIDSPMGLFSNVKPKAIIKNFQLKNSFFKASGTTIGAIASNGAGTYENIYSNAIVSSDSKHGTGGFIGKVDSAGESAVVGFFTKITNCWFDGEMRMTGRNGIEAGGFVGIFSSGTLEMKQVKSSGKLLFESQYRSPHIGGFVGDANATTGTLILNIEGALCSTMIEEPTNIYTAGAYVGRVRANCTASFKDCYATYECWPHDAIRSDAGDYKGNVMQFSEAELLGTGGYRWTRLDFEQYWAATEGDIPILQSFADDTLSVAGIEKAFDLDWYNEYDKKFVIDTKKKFMGFCMLPYLEGATYRGMEIKLACDVVLNEGKASEWGEKAPSFRTKPIGTFATPFQGVFDGQGHTISGLYAVGTNYVGLFGMAAQGSVIRNFRLVNSYIEGESTVGSVVGRSLGNVDTIYSDATVVATSGSVGGIVGQSLELKMAPLTQTISNCWFNGTVEALGDGFSYAGGILGDNRNNHITIDNCLFSGKITSMSTRYNALVGGINGAASNKESASIIKDCLSVGIIEAPKSETKNGIASILGYTGNRNSKVIASYASKECWPQATTGIEGARSTAGQYPKAKLIGNGGYEWTTLDFNKYWSVVTKDTPILKSFATKTISVASLQRKIDISWYDETKKTYVLDSAADLLGFNLIAASDLFEGKTVKLGADIVLNNGDASTWSEKAPDAEWNPIGNGAYPFMGTFDGQGHSISGLYVKRDVSFAGIFAVTGEGSTIKNLKLLNSYVEGIDIVGSIVGRTLGNLDTIYSEAIVVATTGGCNGGIAGQSLSTGEKPSKLTINNCWYDGEMDVQTDSWIYSGGILGDNRNNHVTITNCLYTGHINTASDKWHVYLGGINGSTGIIGGARHERAITTIDGCLSTGTFKTKSSANGSVGAIIGNSSTAKTTVKNCYGIEEAWKWAIGYINNEIVLDEICKKATITGYGGYQWTMLDFDKYWAIRKENTPILKSFAEEVPSLAGIKKYVDYSWYDESKSTYVLDSLADLLTFDRLGQTNDFKGKTIQLGANIEINNREDYKKWGTEAPEINWMPIGNGNMPFEGTFDGKGFEISGLYLQEESSITGIFSVIGRSGSVKNLKLADSYIEGQDVVGSIAGRTLGNLDTIYSNATVVATLGGCNGGIVGQSLHMVGTEEQAKLTINNCWYAGTMNIKHTNWSYSGGILGDNRNNDVTITNCLYTGHIDTACTAWNVFLGGINGSTGIIGTSRFEDAKTTIEGCLSKGTFVTASSANGRVGSIIGDSVNTNSTVKNSYGISDAWKWAVSFTGGTVNMAGLWSKDQISGVKAYEWTNLNFDKYWAIVEGNTPILQSFAKEIPEIGTKTRYLTWFNGHDATYKLDSKEDLIGFSEIGKTYDFAGKTILLEDDITFNEGDAKTWGTTAPANKWEPIGTGDKPFAGKFDGQMHTISGLYVKEQSGLTGMFSMTAKGTYIQNLKLVNSYFEGTDVVGGVVGRTLGDVKNIYTDAIVVATSGGGNGGIVGQTWTEPVTIENCWFAGKVEIRKNSSDLQSGGILGANRGCTTTIKGCLFTGEIYATAEANDLRIAGIVGLVNSGCVTNIDNCISAGKITTPNITGTDYIASVIGRTFDTTHPIPTNTYGTTESCARATMWVGYNGVRTVGQMAKAAMLGVNQAMNLDAKYWTYVRNSVPQLKSFKTGTEIVLTDADRMDTSWYTSTEAGKVYTLSTAGQLLGFAELSKTNNFAGQTIQLSPTLEEGIDLKYIQWTSVGSLSNPFAGTFNGNGKTIKGLCLGSTASGAGMFASTAAGGLVRNFRLVDSYIEALDIVGGIVGRALGSVKDIYSEATVVSTGGGSNGGIVGQAWTSNITIENCWFAGKLEIRKNGGDLQSGGILGANRGCTTTIKGCLFTGEIYATAAANDLRIAGIIGLVNTGCVTNIDNCISAGTITTPNITGTDYIASVIGRTFDKTHPLPTNTYATKESCVKATCWIGYNGYGTTGQLPKDSMTNDQLKGKLDTTYWVFVKDSTPELKSFIKGEEFVENVSLLSKILTPFS